MNANLRHSLVQSTIIAGETVLSKSASATPEQAEVINAAWPQGEGISKTAALAQILGCGLMVEEAQAATA